MSLINFKISCKKVLECARLSLKEVAIFEMRRRKIGSVSRLLHGVNIFGFVFTRLYQVNNHILLLIEVFI